MKKDQETGPSCRPDRSIETLEIFAEKIATQNPQKMLRIRKWQALTYDRTATKKTLANRRKISFTQFLRASQLKPSSLPSEAKDKADFEAPLTCFALPLPTASLIASEAYFSTTQDDFGCSVLARESQDRRARRQDTGSRRWKDSRHVQTRKPHITMRANLRWPLSHCWCCFSLHSSLAPLGWCCLASSLLVVLLLSSSLLWVPFF